MGTHRFQEMMRLVRSSVKTRLLFLSLLVLVFSQGEDLTDVDADSAWAWRDGSWSCLSNSASCDTPIKLGPDVKANTRNAPEEVHSRNTVKLQVPNDLGSANAGYVHRLLQEQQQCPNQALKCPSSSVGSLSTARSMSGRKTKGGYSSGLKIRSKDAPEKMVLTTWEKKMSCSFRCEAGSKMGSDKTCRYEGGTGRPDVRLYACGDILYSEAVALKKTNYGVGKNARFFCTDFKEKVHSTGCTRKSNLITRAGHCTAATLNGRRLNRSCGGLKGFLTRPKSGFKGFCFGSEEKKWAGCSTSLVKANAKLLGEDEQQLLARGGSSASVDCVPKLAGDAKCGWVTYKKVSTFFTTTEGWKCPKVGGGQKCHPYGGSCFDAE